MGTAKKTHLQQMFFSCKTFLASSQQPAGTNKLAVRLALCFLFWDRRLFAEGCAKSTTFWYARCNFAAAGRRQKMPPIFAQMASEQGGHPSKLNTRLLALTGRLCRPKWHIPPYSWYAKSGTLHTKKNTCLRIFRLLVA